MKTMFLVTSEDRIDTYPVRFIDKFYSKERALKCYKELKNDKLVNVRLSKVIM